MANTPWGYHFSIAINAISSGKAADGKGLTFDLRKGLVREPLRFIQKKSITYSVFLFKNLFSGDGTEI
jgi:hypothetical protein